MPPLRIISIVRAHKVFCSSYSVDRLTGKLVICKQKTVTTSTTEADLSHTAKDYLWWKRLFADIGLDLEDENDAPILCDNKQTVTILQRKDPIFKTQLKHVDVHNHWLRQEIQQRRINIHWIPTADMPADDIERLHEGLLKRKGSLSVFKTR